MEHIAKAVQQDKLTASFITEASGKDLPGEYSVTFLTDKPLQGPLSRLDAEFKWKKLIHDSDWPVFKKAFDTCIRTGAALDVICNLVDIAPAPIKISILGKLMHDTSGKPSWIEGIMVPSNNTRLCSGCRQAIIEGEKKAKEFSKNILAVLSHDMRSPLIGILGMLQLLRKSGLTGKQLEYAARASDACELVLELAKNLLDFAKIDSGKDGLSLQEINLPSIVDSMAGLHAEQALRSGISLVIRKNRSFPKAVLCDEVKFRQVLGNLLSNAIKFTPSGAVTLHLTHAPRADGKITAIIEITDTGIGFDLPEARYMFDQFFQMCHQGPLRRMGAGLGLSIVKGVMDLFGGSVCVDSVKGKGSTFIIGLPLETP